MPHNLNTCPQLDELGQLARALVAFSRYVVGKFDSKRKRVIAQELMAFATPCAFTETQLVDFISKSLPEAYRLSPEAVPEFAHELTPRERRAAHIAAMRLIRGSGRVAPNPELLAAAERLFPLA